VTVLDVLVALVIVAALICADAYLHHAAHLAAVTWRPHLARHTRHVIRRAVGVAVAGTSRARRRAPATRRRRQHTRQ